MRRRCLRSLLLFTGEFHAVVLASFEQITKVIFRTYVFRNTDPERGWMVRTRALEAGAQLSKHIKYQLKLARSSPGEVGTWTLFTHSTRANRMHAGARCLAHSHRQGTTSGVIVETQSAHGFLLRLA
jgi:hypothetical protein